MKIALISDSLTYAALQDEGDITPITPLNYLWQLRFNRFDFLLIESAWEGFKGSWKYKIARYPDVPKRNNVPLQKVIALAKDKGIKVVFWNKEDGVHFNRFIDSACLCDVIFTVDENVIPLYKARLGGNFPVKTLMFAVQPRLHSYTGFNPKYMRANFVGSYSTHVHDERRAWQNMLFEASHPLGITYYDRNSSRKAPHYRFPKHLHSQTHPSVSYAETAQIYKDHLVSINCNTITDSTTMFSRRLVEILAVGGIAVTNPSLSIETHFKDYCIAIRSKEEADELMLRFAKGDYKKEIECAKEGAHFVANHFIWKKRLEDIANHI